MIHYHDLFTSACSMTSILDIDECTMGTDNCAPEATCTNTEGSFTCTCNQGYTGNGTSCTGKIVNVHVRHAHLYLHNVCHIDMAERAIV